MPRCPECGKEIDHLIYHTCELATVLLNAVGTIDYIPWAMGACTNDSPEYRCPECGIVLFDNEEDAEAS